MKEIVNRICAALNGNDEEEVRSALNEFLKSVREDLLQFARRVVKCSDLAEDVVQNVSVRLWEKPARLTNVRDFNAYFFTIVKREAVKALRERRREVLGKAQYTLWVDLGGALVVTAEDDLPETGLPEEWDLSGLRERDRRLFNQVCVEKLRYDTLAKIYNVKPNTIAKRFERIKLRLRRSRSVDFGGKNVQPNTTL